MLGFNAATVISIIVLVVFLVLFFLSWAQIERGREINLRPLQALNRLRRMVSSTVETGTDFHYSTGSGGLSGQVGTAETLSSLTSLSTVQQVAARSKGKVITSTNDAFTYLLAADVAGAEYERAGRMQDYRPEATRLITQQENLGYIAGVAAITGNSNVSGSAIIGRMGPEYLLAGDVANRRDIPQVAGTTQPETMPLMVASAGLDNVLLGEEMYAAPAYLSRQPAHLASIRTQDILRVLLIVAIILGVVAATLGFNIGDYFLH